MLNPLRCFCVACLFLWNGTANAGDAPLRFESHVRGLLKTHCWHCHGEEEKPEGGLDLRLVRFLSKGGESGPAIVPNQPEASLLIQRIESGDMPPGDKKVSPEELALLKQWIRDGAQTLRPEPETINVDSPWTEEEKGYWAFQPVRRPAVPAVKETEQVRTPIDAFLLKSLEEKGVSLSPDADRRVLIRRLSFDLTGLPPTPQETEAFVQDTAPLAYERLVDRLLENPAYGERWGRHWLDVAGYADSDGYTEVDNVRPWAFRYRDYVIRAFNDDKPFDRFLVEQLAGDELLTPPYQNLAPDQADLLAATGFLRMAPDGTAGGADANTARNDVVADTIKIVSSSVLGMTVGCAQCHDHRYDAISHVDYYRFRAIFEPALDWKNWRVPNGRLVSLWQPAEVQKAADVDKEIRAISTQRGEALDDIVQDILQKELAKLDGELASEAAYARDLPEKDRPPQLAQILKDFPSLNVSRGSAYLYEPKRVKDHNDKFDKLTAETKAQRPADQMVACLTEVPGKVPPTKLFSRGDFNQPRQDVTPGELSVLGDLVAAIAPDNPAIPTTGRRLAFAKSLTSGKHPLVARVLVNRIWMNHFGRGIVASAGDFGILGARPTHPELLDWLADEFVQNGWSVKHLHRLILNSTAFRQSSARTAELDRVDQDNLLLGRMPLRRLETEVIRDSILDIAGTRSDRMLGPASTVLPDDVGQIIVGDGERDGNGILIGKANGAGDTATRRSIYVQVRRSMPLGMLEPFDVASTAPNCEVRNVSTAAPQSLLLMNSDFILKQSEAFAQRVQSTAGDDVAAQVRHAWELAFGEAPATEVVSDGSAFVEAQRVHFAAHPNPAKNALPAPTQALALFCQSLLCSNRFLYVD
ncbi:PSD1 and planctomycete cytochrome C domain-containing protein [Planctomyces sp. SH-PL14]|uniref:PSD1 and planctomycete cytochrome C domain-containing protein n=1 Tax=Planctomyces sp. SH-PL14 TaxID=1632864 RepID=UPI00078C384D|nr:PSD1 and planctomycete cytochrome C domain-containing protein [Planctomyces sp. SH-PL14]AMV21893.1 Planctomycete cytochrome C [Planctomyces sp. SH-PL14]